MLKIVTSSEVGPKDTTAVRDVFQGRAAEGRKPQAQFEKAVEGWQCVSSQDDSGSVTFCYSVSRDF